MTEVKQEEIVYLMTLAEVFVSLRQVLNKVLMPVLLEVFHINNLFNFVVSFQR